jgi:two-component system OmpR family response regulator
MKSRILVVADDAALRATLARTLLQAGYAVELAESAKRARDVLADESVALGIVAPQGLGAAGVELAGEIEKTRRLLLIIEKTGEAPPPGLAAQPAACLSRPFSEEDLVSRVKAALSEARPVAAAPQEASLLAKFEGYTLDTDARTCVDAKGKELTLTRAEFSLLAAFVRQPRRVLSRDELTYVVAGRGAEPDDRSVDVLISRLRRKIEPDPKTPRIIVTMPGEGYKFTAPTEQIARARPLVVAAPSTVPAVRAGAEPDGEIIAVGRRGVRALWAGAAVLVVLAVAVIGWTSWKFRTVSKEVAQVAQAISSPPAPPSSPSPSPTVSQEVQRALVFKRMVAALQDDRYSWRTIERLAIETGVEEAEAHEILAEHPDQIVLGKSHEGKLIARLSAR